MKVKDISDMNKEQRERKLEELKLELIKSKINPSKSGSSKIKQIKKLISRIHTLNASKKEVLKKQ